MRTPLMVVGLLLGALVGCNPTSSGYNRGVGSSYRPAAQENVPAPLVDQAVEIRQESDLEAIKAAGGVYLGDVVVSAERSSGAYAGPANVGALSGRVAYDVASKGGTHFYLSKVDTQSGTGAKPGSFKIEPYTRTMAHYVTYRVEPDSWSKLDPKYQPSPKANASAP